MLMKQDAHLRSFNHYMGLFFLLCVGFIFLSHSVYGDDDFYDEDAYEICEEPRYHAANQSTQQTLTYYLSIEDFALSFIEIPSSNVSGESTTISSKYLAGRAAIYNNANNKKVGTCSASFLCMQNADGIYTDISNYLSTDSGLIVSWFTPTTLINLELDSIINSMVTECLVTASTKIGASVFYGQTFDLVVSSENGRIYFKFTRTGTIF